MKSGERGLPARSFRQLAESTRYAGTMQTFRLAAEIDRLAACAPQISRFTASTP
jgi:hypothetical protein